MKEIQLTQGFVAFVDDEDYERINKHKWYVMAARHGWRAGTRYNPGDKTSTYMHSLVLQTAQTVDHIDRNGLNNQKSNLRLCTTSQNVANSGKRSNNTSGFKGVYFCKCTNKWRAEIKVDGNKKCLGRYSTKEEAALAYNTGAKHYFGEFAYQNLV